MSLALLLITLKYFKKQELIKLPLNKGADYLNNCLNYIIKY
jgi:hypothetical protein